jgi:hypothetical protein
LSESTPRNIEGKGSLELAARHSSVYSAASGREYGIPQCVVHAEKDTALSRQNRHVIIHILYKYICVYDDVLYIYIYIYISRPVVKALGNKPNGRGFETR